MVRRVRSLYGGSGFSGGVGDVVMMRLSMGVGRGRRMEQLLSFKNEPSLSDVSSDWRIAGSLHGRVMNLLLFPL